MEKQMQNSHKFSALPPTVMRKVLCRILQLYLLNSLIYKDFKYLFVFSITIQKGEKL